MAFNWYLTLPGDSDIVAQHPANERAFRTTVNSAFGIEHNTTEGRHKFGIGNDAARDAISGWSNGSIWFNSQDARRRLQVLVSGTWRDSVEFVAGTVVIFRQATAPLGWTRQVDVTDRMLRIMSAGLTSGGAWAISGLAAGGAHTHTVSGPTDSESAHTHSYSGTTDDDTSPSANSESGTGASRIAHTHDFSGTTGAGGSHAHSFSVTSGGISANHTHAGDGTWRPLYTDVIAAEKD